jgi:hypothetical protein
LLANTNFKLGFFADFKGADSVLICGSSNAMAILVLRLKEFVTSPLTEIHIHDLAVVSSSHPAKLSAVRSTLTAASGFCWLCSSEETESIFGKLNALANCTSGHQYFDLLGSECQLVVSVGEYSDAWWNHHD